MSEIDPFATLRETALALENGDVDSRSLTSSMLERIECLNPEINCYLDVFGEASIEQAERLDREAASRGRRGPMHGIPVAIKDIFDFSGRPASGGSLPLRETAGAEDAELVRRLERAGAVLLGVLNLDELAAGGSGDNAHFGRCRNPRDPARCSGGSSGGSAAAVAAGLAFASIGSDAGGSIRIPAAFCGVAGLKPTYGRVSRAGALARSWSMDCIGPLARGIDDLAMVLDTIAGIDPRDPSSVSSEPTGPIATNGRRRRIGWVDTLPAGLDPGEDPNLEHCRRQLEKAGHRIEPASIHRLDTYTELHQVLVKSEGAAMHHQALTDPDSSMSHAVRSVIRGGLDVPAWRYIDALSRRDEYLAGFIEQDLTDFDLLALPVSLPVAPLFESADNRTAADIDAAFSATATLTRFANYLGVPALSMPTGVDAAGLPTAIQFVARPFAESLLFEVAAELERERGPLPYPAL